MPPVETCAMTKLEAALLEAIGLQQGIVTGMTLDFAPPELPVLYVELGLQPPSLDGLADTLIKRFELVEIPEEEPASCPSAP